MSKKYVVLGGGGSFGLHTSKYLLDSTDAERVISVGRAPEKLECFTLGIGKNDPRYSYHSIHLNFELDILFELLDKEKPDVIINCVGLIKQLICSNDPLKVLPINSILPHRLAKLAITRGARFIHYSTDCIFSGGKGSYTENDKSD